MEHQLSPDLQHALHGSQNELEIVDPSTNQHYMIVPKDRWLQRNDVHETAARDADPKGRWTDDKNLRRAELVDREIAGTLSADERMELDSLQQQMRMYRDQVAPLPIADTRQLHAELMQKARQAQKA